MIRRLFQPARFVGNDNDQTEVEVQTNGVRIAAEVSGFDAKAVRAVRRNKSVGAYFLAPPALSAQLVLVLCELRLDVLLRLTLPDHLVAIPPQEVIPRARGEISTARVEN
jgi:hypothetical protein